jgi:hypothetical protein
VAPIAGLDTKDLHLSIPELYLSDPAFLNERWVVFCSPRRINKKEERFSLKFHVFFIDYSNFSCTLIGIE